MSAVGALFVILAALIGLYLAFAASLYIGLGALAIILLLAGVAMIQADDED